MAPLDMALYVVVVPALAAAVLVAVIGWVGRRVGMAGAGRAAVALALGAGVVAAQFGNAPPSFPPIDVTDRLPWLVLAASLLGVCESGWPSPAWARWENRLLLTILTLGLVLGPLLGPDWPTRRALVGQGGVVLFILAAWGNLESLAAGRSTAVLGPSLIIVAASAAVALLLSGSIVLFQIGGGLAASLAAVWVLSWWLPDRSLDRGGVPVLVATLAALLIMGHIYSVGNSVTSLGILDVASQRIEGHVYTGLPLSAVLLLGGAPFATWAGFVGPARRLAPWQSALLSAVATLVPSAIALGLAYAASPSFE